MSVIELRLFLLKLQSDLFFTILGGLDPVWILVLDPSSIVFHWGSYMDPNGSLDSIEVGHSPQRSPS